MSRLLYWKQRQKRKIAQLKDITEVRDRETEVGTC